MARSVGDDELAARGGEVPVSDVNRDALLAFGTQTVGQQREVDSSGRPVDRRLGDRLDLVLVNIAGVVKQTSDQGGLAVVDAARGGKSQQILGSFPCQEIVNRELWDR